MKNFTRLSVIVLIVAMLTALTTVSYAVTIETVPVGNPGNAGEWAGESYDGTGADRLCGAVGYAYRIGKYEVSADQWAAAIADDSNVGNAGIWSGSQPTAGAERGRQVRQLDDDGQCHIRLLHDRRRR